MSRKNENREPRQDGRRSGRRVASTAELSELNNFVSSLQIGVTPTVKVNGPHYSTALVVVDLGQPIKQIRLTSDQSAELGQRLRRAAKELLGRDASVRVSADNSHGIHWASLAN